MGRGLRIVPLALLLGLVVAGIVARRELGIEGSLAGVQAFVQHLGWWGPVAYVLVVVFRQFLALPAALVLLVGGLCFGGLVGTMLGTAGIVLSGLMKFGIARAIGRDWLRGHFGPRFEAIDARVGRLGPTLVGFGTAYPVGPLSPFHWAAGLSSISLGSFAAALVLGAPVRASAYSFLGASMLDRWSPEFVITVGLLALALLPLASARFRRRLFADPPPPR